jgi:hypothetical protein
MIPGTVNARHEILIRVPIRDAAGQEQPVEVVLDTGFTGSLTLPSAWIARLGLLWRSGEGNDGPRGEPFGNPEGFRIVPGLRPHRRPQGGALNSRRTRT